MDISQMPVSGRYANELIATINARRFFFVEDSSRNVGYANEFN